MPVAAAPEAVSTGAAQPASAVEAPASELQRGTKPPPLRSSNTFIQRDAATYGITWKPPQQHTFWSPQQAREAHHKWLKLLGRIGWTAKGIIYSLIGGLACKNAAGDKDSSASPQGAFVLIGTPNGGQAALIVLAIALATYAAWRFWEGFVGQGYDDTFSNMKNFFKFRLSPVVSGGVYTAYDVLVIKLIPQNDGEEYLSSSTWPNSWHDSNIGKAGLVLCGLAFLAATVVQLEQFVTKSFHNTLRKELWKPFRYFVLTCGHIGVLGRAGIFLFAAILFFRTIRDVVGGNKTVFGDALAQLQSTSEGCAALFIMGFFVVIYGLFAVLNVYAREFPTPPPSGIPRVRHYTSTGGEPPLLPQFGPGGAGFRPLSPPPGQQPGTTRKPGNAREDARGKSRQAAVQVAATQPRPFAPMTSALAAKGLMPTHMNGTVHSGSDGDIEMGSLET